MEMELYMQPCVFVPPGVSALVGAQVRRQLRGLLQQVKVEVEREEEEARAEGHARARVWVKGAADTEGSSKGKEAAAAAASGVRRKAAAAAAAAAAPSWSLLPPMVPSSSPAHQLLAPLFQPLPGIDAASFYAIPAGALALALSLAQQSPGATAAASFAAAVKARA